METMPAEIGQPTPLLKAMNEFTRTGVAGPAVAALEEMGYVDTLSDQIHRPLAKGHMYMEFLGPDFMIVTRQSSPASKPQYAEYAIVGYD